MRSMLMGILIALSLLALPAEPPAHAAGSTKAQGCEAAAQLAEMFRQLFVECTQTHINETECIKYLNLQKYWENFLLSYCID